MKDEITTGFSGRLKSQNGGVKTTFKILFQNRKPQLVARKLYPGS